MDLSSAARLRGRHRAMATPPAATLAAVTLAAATIAAATLAGCAATNAPPASANAPPAVAGRQIVPGPWLRLGAPARAAARRPTPARKAPTKPPTTWLINPDRPLPPDSPWRPVLAVARRFAIADMSFEVDQVGPAVRAAIAHTCTGAFAAALFSHRAILPPGVTAQQVRQRLVALTPLERLAKVANVLATVRSAGRGGAPGAFELGLVPRAGGWRVAGIRVV